MTYGIDLRKRVVSYVKSGGSKSSASRRYEVSLWCVNDWCRRETLAAKKYERTKQGKLDWRALSRDVDENPDLLQKERAKKFNVKASAISYALKQMKITRKKNYKV